MSNIHGFGPVGRRDDSQGKGEHLSSHGHSSGTAVYRPAGPMDELVARARGQQGSRDAEDRQLGVITLYANGFQIGQGPFRDAKEPRNAQFLKELKEGFVPAELEPEVRREWGPAADTVRINLVDKTRETYVPPKPKFDFSTSVGQSLGGAAPGAGAAAFRTAVAREYKASGEGKTTTLQIVAGPAKHRVTMGEDATVMQLYQHVMFLTKQPAGFELIAGFPPKPLSDPNTTLKAAGLLSASVTVRGGAAPAKR